MIFLKINKNYHNNSFFALFFEANLRKIRMRELVKTQKKLIALFFDNISKTYFELRTFVRLRRILVRRAISTSRKRQNKITY